MKRFKGVSVLIGPSTFAAMDPAPLERLNELGFEVIDNPFKRKLSKDEVIELLSDDILGVIAGLEPMDRDVLKKSNLKVISRCGSGMSNVNMAAAREMGIWVHSTPYGPTNSVAEATLGAILSLIRMLPEMDRSLHEGKWNKRIGNLLEGKTVVVVGFGRIGQRVKELLMPFRTTIIAVDTREQDSLEGVTFMPLEDALPLADIVTLHASGEDCIIAGRELSLLKSGSFLLNAARGGLIDEAALAEAMDKGVVAGAWLDTFEREPYDGVLIKYPQVILTPHIGSYTVECRRSMEMESVENLISAFREIL